jgi:hypothetical protein
MAAEWKGRMIGGEGKVAEIGGGFGGYVKQPTIEITVAIVALPKIRMASASVVIIREAAIHSRPRSARKAA